MSIGNFKEENIKSKIKYIIKSSTSNEEETKFGRIEKNKIIYKEKNILVTIIKKDKEILVTREDNEFKQIIKFKVNKKTISEYYIKDINISLEFNIYTNKLIIENNHINIKYTIIETNENFEYDIQILNDEEEL